MENRMSEDLYGRLRAAMGRSGKLLRIGYVAPATWELVENGEAVHVFSGTDGFSQLPHTVVPGLLREPSMQLAGRALRLILEVVDPPAPKAYAAHAAAPSGNEWTWLPGHALWRRVEDWHDAPATVGRDDLDAYDAAHPMAGEGNRKAHHAAIARLDAQISRWMCLLEPDVEPAITPELATAAAEIELAMAAAEVVERLTAARANLLAAGPSPE